MLKIALLTCDNLESYVTDEHFLEDAIKAKGWSYQWVIWNHAEVNWQDFDAAIIRTTWDYIKAKDQFLSVLKEIEDSHCRLFNPLSVVQWNTDKKYLQELESKGISIPPTDWVMNCTLEQLQTFKEKNNCEKVVVKPNIGAGAFKTYLLGDDNKANWSESLESLLGQEVMLQPYLPQIAEEGEFSLHFFNRQLSHTILKKPKAGDFRSQEEFGSFIQRVEATPDMMRFSQKVLGLFSEDLLYARVDIVRSDESFFLMELELIEPSLYFRFYEPSGTLFVKALEELK